jgi:hypothetical protein
VEKSPVILRRKTNAEPLGGTLYELIFACHPERSEGSNTTAACEDPAGFFPSAPAPGQNDKHGSSLAVQQRSHLDLRRTSQGADLRLDSSLALEMTGK